MSCGSIRPYEACIRMFSSCKLLAYRGVLSASEAHNQ